jgi:hypothetical protein
MPSTGTIMEGVIGMAEHFTGSIMRDIVRRINGADGITVDQQQQNAFFGIHQVRVRIPDDPRPYRLVLAPADAPLSATVSDVGPGIPLDSHMAHPISRDFDQ